MKLQYIILSGIAAVLGVMFSSCEYYTEADDGFIPTLQDKYLVVSEVHLEFSPSSDSKFVDIITLGVPWQISNLPEWITVDKTSGSSEPGDWAYYYGDRVTITAMDNDSAEDRSAVFSVTAYGDGWTLTQNVEVTQRGADPYISFHRSFLTVPGGAHTESIGVDTNCPNMELSCTESWVTATYDEATRKVNLTFEENMTESNRSALIYASFHSGSFILDDFTVTQVPSSVEWRSSCR